MHHHVWKLTFTGFTVRRAVVCFEAAERQHMLDGIQYWIVAFKIIVPQLIAAPYRTLLTG
jgi:hypothetical protein